ncbi:unnamed protein product [Vicia faba]|uniref:Transposase (putative) gypsy type domain-containing protein n=1 Tax=Vicia faba TaxID=3906 RepID=A0AAV1AZB3_VICFA|nr:unnamed protein product [Vicia faba]
MVIIKECDDFGNKRRNNDEEQRVIWEECMQEMRTALGVDEYARVMSKVYSEIFTSESDSDPDSSGSVEVLMETSVSFSGEVMGYDQISMNEVEIAKLRSLRKVSSIGNEDMWSWGACIPGKRVCMSRPNGVQDEWFYFYARVLEDMFIRIPFIDFEVDVLKTVNVAPSQLRPNSWGFIKAFEMICEVLDVTPTIGLFFFFLF